MGKHIRLFGYKITRKINVIYERMMNHSYKFMLGNRIDMYVTYGAYAVE